MVKAISGYLQRSGAIGVLVHLKSDSKRFNELKDLVGVSPSTLSDRLDKGADLGLITTRIGKDEYERDQRAVHHEYMITDRGLLVLSKMEEFDVIFAYRKLREAEERLDEGIEDMHDWIAEDSDRIALAAEVHPTKDREGEDVTGYDGETDYSEHMERPKDTDSSD
ncbi:winged helix-turn-helix transcriptional regulator [Haloarcula marina]|uniref:winged helix-turn-helix transcriptional regulator n=1 Tax=Haloarcula marina TaxID=2961574 RepID=UPI0020B79B47|nr:winged helix-turn-helix transcriptional regulator [Halomicroarcula marina]